MALSGSFGNTFRTGYRLQIDWSAFQDAGANTSTVDIHMYLVSLGSQYPIDSSAPKSGRTNIHGYGSTFTGSARLSGNQKKWLHSQRQVVQHTNDGRAIINISGAFDIGVTLGGQYYDTVSTSVTATLDTIPRASTVSSSINFFALSNLAISINRASTGFTHTAEISVGGTLVKTLTGLTTSGTFSFTQAENTTILQRINANDRIATSVTITLKTYSGSTLIGTTTKAGSVSAPLASTVTFNPSSPTLGTNPIAGSFTTSSTGLTHTVLITLGSFSKTLTGLGTTFSWTPTESEHNSMLSQVTGTSRDANVTVTTFFNGVQVKYATYTTFTLNVNETAPTFTASQVTFSDTNSTTTAITGNNQYFIQNHSTLTVSIDSPAVAHNGATISQYVLTLNGVTATMTSTGTYSFGTIDSSSNVTLQVKAVDSRGNSTTISHVINVVAYTVPTVSVSGARTGGFGEDTVVTLRGAFSTLLVEGVNKNTLSSLQYRYKATTGASWSSWTSHTFTTSGSAWAGNALNLTLSALDSFSVEVKISDRFSTTTNSTSIRAGSPLMFLDSTNKALGINKFPEAPYTLDVAGMARFDGSIVSNGLSSSSTSTNNIFGTTNLQTVNVSGTATFSRTHSILAQGELSLQNGWVNYSSPSEGFARASYKKLSSGLVILTGLVTSGTLQAVITSLPVGCRPTKILTFAGVEGGNWASRIDVSPSGEIKMISGATGWCSFSNIAFYAE